MGFRFSLAAVLSVKQSIEKREDIALQRTQLQIARTRRNIQELDDEIARANEMREKELQRTIQGNRLQSIQLEIDEAKGKKEEQIASLESLKHQRDLQMKTYRLAHSERQIFTDLLTQQKSAYEHEQLRIQQKRLDDIVTSRWRRS
jgi:flagellar export protein FliJ